MKSYSVKSYLRASTFALLLAWAAAIIIHGIRSLLAFGNLKGYDTVVIAFWSFTFMMLANGLFIQWPEKFISNFCRSNNYSTFVLASTAYAIIAFLLMIGWLFFLSGAFLIVFDDALIIGLVFGLLFPGIWAYAKP